MSSASSAALAAVLLASLVPASVAAETHAAVAAGGGLAALDVKVDLARRVVTASGTEIPIPIEAGELPPEAAVVVEAVPIGQGKSIAHVRVPLKDSEGEGGPAWEVLLAGGRKEPLFDGMTGPTTGDPGERTGKAIQVVANGPTSFVLVGDTREDLRICGQPVTLLDPLALYPGSLELRPATVQRLSAEQRADAESIIAKEKTGGSDTPLAQLLVSRGSSVPDSRGLELTDGDPQTVWREMRPGIGQGEFVVMAAPKGVPITRMQITVSPPAKGPLNPNGASPKTFYLVTTVGAYAITLPSDGWTKPGATYEVTFPKPVETTCVALVLEAAFARGNPHPDVGLAELTAYSELDRKSVV
jgi:hypothetical protein